MNRRRVVGIGLGVVLLTCVIAGALIYAARQSPLERAYHRLRLDMTLDDVVAVIGRLPDDPKDPDLSMAYEPFFHPTHLQEAGIPLEQRPVRSTVQCWAWDENLLCVIFDSGGKAIRLELATAPKPPFLERLRNWLGF